MKEETKGKANISLVALALVIVITCAIVCGILVVTPFIIKWIVAFLILLGKSFITIF